MADLPASKAADMPAPLLNIQLCYARPDKVFHMDLQLPPGSTLLQAVDASGVLQQFPEIDLGVSKVGIFGKLKVLESLLREGDRIEIYRPLQADPKESRRNRARRQR